MFDSDHVHKGSTKMALNLIKTSLGFLKIGEEWRNTTKKAQDHSEWKQNADLHNIYPKIWHKQFLPVKIIRPSTDTLANSGSVLLRYFGDK